MKTPTINSRIVKLEVLKDTATRTSVNAVESRTTSLESDVATAQSDISTLQTDVSTVEGDISTLQGNVATLTQGIVDAVSTHNTAPDAHADIRTLVADRALIGHQHARADLPWVTEPGAALLTAASAAVQRGILGLTGWATNQWTNGTTDDVPEGARLYFTVDRANACADARIAVQKGQAEGIMPLDSGGKAPLAYMPDALIGQVKFKGVWDAATNSPVLPSATTSMGHYYVTSVAGSYGGIDYGVGDWCISDGTAWGKVDNSDAITSFAGRVGAILPIASDYSSFYLGLHAQAADSAKFGGQLPAYYAQASHTHTFTSLTSKPTTLAGYGITDAAAASHVHSGYETAIGNPSVSGYLLSSTPAGVRSWVAPYAHPATHAQSVIDSAAGWITTALAGKQPAGSYLTTSGTAADSSKLGGVAASGYSQTSHTHNYAGSASPGGAATTALECTGNSATANSAKYPQFYEDALDPAGVDISQRIHSGIYQGNPDYGVTTAKGWPMNGEWTHLIAATHNNKGNNYSMQIAGHFFFQRFFARNTNNNGTTPWVELLHTGNVGYATPDGALSFAKTSGLKNALDAMAVGYPLTWFGGDGSESSPNTWTTDQFIAFLVNRGAFNQPQWSSRGQWSYVGNRVITDTGVGHIHLAGATVEVFKGTLDEYLVRVTTGPTTSVSGAVPKAVFIYENHGADYAPGWFRLMGAEQYPNLHAIESLSGAAGVPVKTAANTWELKNGNTAAVVIGGTTLNFQNGVLMSYLST